MNVYLLKVSAWYMHNRCSCLC